MATGWEMAATAWAIARPVNMLAEGLMWSENSFRARYLSHLNVIAGKDAYVTIATTIVSLFRSFAL